MNKTVNYVLDQVMSNQVNASIHVQLDSVPLNCVAELIFVPVALHNLQPFNSHIFGTEILALGRLQRFECVHVEQTHINQYAHKMIFLTL